MQRFVCVLLLLLACCHPSHAQSSVAPLLPTALHETPPWLPIQGAEGLRGPLDAIFFADASHGWIVGHKGTLITTQDGGAYWTKQVSGTQESLHAVFFRDPLRGWAAGDHGVLLSTQDGGGHWQTIPTGTTEALRSVRFVADQGFLVGDKGTHLVSKDGGATWTSVSQDPRPALYATAQTGTSLFVVGGRSVTYETRLGRYVEIASRLTQKREPSAILTSADGGATWIRREAPTKVPLFAVYASDPSHVWAVGGDMRYTRDWLRGKMPTFGYPAVVASEDGGATWKEQHLDESFKGSLTDVWFADAQEGWTVGFNNQEQPPLMPITVPLAQLAAYFHTMDGGRTWTRVQWFPALVAQHLFFLDRLHGWALATDGSVLRYTRRWSAIHLFNEGQLEAALARTRLDIQSDPRDVEALYLQSLILARLNRPQDARNSTDAALALLPEHAPSLLLLAVLEYGAHHEDAALEAARHVTSVDANNAEGFYLIGAIHSDRGQPDLARPYLQRYLLLKPDGPMAAAAKERMQGRRQDL